MKGIAKRRSREGGNPERAVQRGKTVLCSRLRGNDVKRASRRNGTLYIGVTSNLVQRVWNHKQGLAEGFTSKYSAKMLVYFEPHEIAESAITREKQLKKWERAWKMR
jgi:putative endonuclease